MRFKLLFLSLAAALAMSYPAGAVIKHYNLSWTTINQNNTANPSLNKYPNGGGKGGDQAVNQGFIDDTNSGNPVLRRLLLVLETEVTVHAPGLSGFIFLSMVAQQGPKKGTTFTGTGDTSSSIRWGTVTGWTVTGGFFCHSNPSTLCVYAQGSDKTTVDAMFQSTAYDLGTWSFHGTGFTSVPYINSKSPPASMSVGNAQYHLKGRLAGGLVPALPVLGVALLGASLLFAGARLSRKR